MEEINFSLGQRFAEERQRLGKTQQEVADLCHVTRRTVGDIERGARPPGGELTQGLTKLGFDIQYVFSGIRSANLEKVADFWMVAEDGRVYAIEAKTSKKVVDRAVLTGVMAGVDEYLAEQKLSMPSDKKADLVILLCDFFNAESAKDTPAVKETTARIIQFGRYR